MSRPPLTLLVPFWATACFKMPSQSPGTWTAGSVGSAWAKWNHVSSDGATCCGGHGSSECTLLHENRSPEGQWSFSGWDSWNTRGLFMQRTQHRANPPLHKSAYKAADLLEWGGVQSTNISVIFCLCHGAGERNKRLYLLLLWQHIVPVHNTESMWFYHQITFTRKHFRIIWKEHNFGFFYP